MTKTPKTPRTPKTQDPRRLFVLGVLGVLGVLAATAPLEDIPNTAPVVTNEEDAVAMAAVGALGEALSNDVAELSSAFDAKLAGGTNAVMETMDERLAAESNRIEATYAKLSDIPAQDDLSPYALKSELPTDYLTENDITNFATRAWIASQGYATSAGTAARLDAQDLAIVAASQRVEIVDNAWRAADAAASNRVTGVENTARNNLAAATNALWIAHRADANALRAADAAASNRVTGVENTARNNLAAATNRVWQGVRAASNELARADARLDAKIDALELTGGMTRLYTSDARLWQDATGTVWQVQDSLGPWQATTSSVQFVTWEDLSTEEYDLWKIHFTVDGTNAEGYAASPAGLTSYTLPAGEWGYESGDPGEFDVSFVRPTIPGGATNAVNRVAYTNDLAAATNGVMGEVDERFDQLGEMGTVYAATRLVDQTGGGHDDVTAETVARKQDALPYPTNAIPYAAISGAPSGAPEWNVKTQDCDFVEFVTNGMAHVRWWNSNTTDISDLGAWPDGAAMMVRFVKQEPVTSWGVVPYIRLVGYGTWPTNDFQSVWWRSGTNIFVNILVEE